MEVRRVGWSDSRPIILDWPELNSDLMDLNRVLYNRRHWSVTLEAEPMHQSNYIS